MRPFVLAVVLSVGSLLGAAAHAAPAEFTVTHVVREPGSGEPQ
jgi:hypothetical protein